MSRLVTVVFLGSPKSDHASHAHEVPLVMSVPLMLLAVPSVFAGYGFVGEYFLTYLPHRGPHGRTWSPSCAVSACVLGAAVAWFLYRRKKAGASSSASSRTNSTSTNSTRSLIKWTQDLIASYTSWFDRWVLDWGIVRWPRRRRHIRRFGMVLRFLQIGNLQAYAFLFGAGVSP